MRASSSVLDTCRVATSEPTNGKQACADQCEHEADSAQAVGGRELLGKVCQFLYADTTRFDGIGSVRLVLASTGWIGDGPVAELLRLCQSGSHGLRPCSSNIR